MARAKQINHQGGKFLRLVPREINLFDGILLGFIRNLFPIGIYLEPEKQCKETS